VSTIVELVDAQAGCRPGSPALLAPGRRPATYADLAAQLRRCAAALREAGLSGDDGVAVAPPDGPEAATAFLSVAACASCIALPARSTTQEIRAMVSDAGVAALIAPPAIARAFRQAADALGLALFELHAFPDRPAGCFELVQLAAAPATRPAHARWPGGPPGALDAAGGRSMAALLQLTPEDRCMNVMAPVHGARLADELLATIVAGGSTVCVSEMQDESFFDWVADFQPTWYTATPAVHRAILGRGREYRRRAPAHRFRFVHSAPAGLSPETARELEDLLDAPLIEPGDRGGDPGNRAPRGQCFL